ncbi:hypothetical protein AB0G74_34000 [Streptomyces sp. NPDC020875]|uniref:hypothetical protein n=1 Tax=Streptomyces sp. NPDC020875 TaxID=3154898 RepID=UPI0033FD3D65
MDALPPSLLRAVLADPEHLPEHLARFALRHMGPAADRSVARVRERNPDADPAELRALVVARGRRNTVAEGAFVGGPFLLLIPVAFCAALLNQARTVLELAGLDGRDPTSPERAAELLVLMGVYPDTDRAGAALGALDASDASDTGPDPGSAESPHRPHRLRRRRRPAVVAVWGVTLRMARLLGLITPPGSRRDGPGRARRAAITTANLLLLAAVIVVGTVAPLVWLPYMALSYNRATGRLTDRAALYYFREPAPRPDRTVPGLAGASARAAVSLLVPAVLTAVVLVVGWRIEHARWPVVTMVLALSSVGTGLWWRARRRARSTADEP